MKPSILDKLDSLADEHPHKLLYSYLDLNGDEIERYSYGSFLRRTKVIAGLLRKEHRFAARDRLLLAYSPGLEMICAFFGCIRAGLIPVPVYPPSSNGFQSALYKMVHIAQDCHASGVLTGKDYHGSLKTNLARTGVSVPLLDVHCISDLPWIETEDFVDSISDQTFAGENLLFLQYTSGSTRDPKGVMVTHENILHNCRQVIDHPAPIVASWLPQYHDMGLIGCYLYPAITGGTTYGFAPTDFIQRPALWFDTIKTYQATASAAPNFAYDYCLRAGRLSTESLENCDLSSLRLLLAAAEPIKPDTYTRFLEKFQPYGLKPESFFVAYGLAENTLAVSQRGRNIVSVDKSAIARGEAKLSEADSATRIISCGTPLPEMAVKIVDPGKHLPSDPGQIGEIWIAGKSKCLGYWSNPELTLKMFHARLLDASPNDDGYLRTGDMGFFHDGELFVCGRIKDMIIVRGHNYYPQDIEEVVEKASAGLIRTNCVVAFQIHEDGAPALAVVAEVKNPRNLPDALEIAAAVRDFLNLEVALISFVAPKGIPRTSSGKTMRNQAKKMWQDGQFQVLSQFSREKDVAPAASGSEGQFPVDLLKARYGLIGTESSTLAESGFDSLDLVVVMHEIRELLKCKGADVLARQVDIDLIQRISVADLFRLVEELEHAPHDALIQLRDSLTAFREDQRAVEEQMMKNDRKLAFEPSARVGLPESAIPKNVLLTGGSGFIGPFLIKSLLEQTSAKVYVLVRSSDDHHGMQRLRAAMESMGPSAAGLMGIFEARVIPVCGDLGHAKLGLPQELWDFLTNEIDTVFHNAAAVNYLFNYDRIRHANVLGTNEVLRLAFEGRPKTFNYISTVFVFGWAVKEVLYESDLNENMERLDFGYSQSKWVAEQVVMDAQRRGLATRVFRPGFVSPPVNLEGNNLDLAVRLVAFMLKHGIGLNALNQVSFVPADIAANNIVAISTMPGTIDKTYHVTRDDDANMLDITALITKVTGRQFEMFNLPAFVRELISRCGKDDLLYPLLDFLAGSMDNISTMEFKRYDSSSYKTARNASAWGMADPSLEETVSGMLRYMQRKGIVSVREPADSAVG
jgi:thioester reductase-like protein